MESTTAESNEEKDVAWLEALDKKLWREYEVEHWFGNRRQLVTRRDVACAPSPRDLTLLTDLIKRNKFAVTLGCGVLGFGYSMAIHVPPLYPELPVDCVFVLTSQHFRGFVKENDAAKEAAWQFFSGLALTDENKARCKFLKLEVPENNPSKYDY